MTKITQTMSTKKKKEEYIDTREIQVDGKKSDILVKITFDVEKGTIAITPRITTKHLSFDEVQKDAVLQQVSDMTRRAYELAMELIEGYLEANRPDGHGQLSLLDIPPAPEMDGDGGPDDEAQPSVRKRKVKATGHE